MVVMQFVLSMADVRSVAPHPKALCTRIPARMISAGAEALHSTLCPGDDPAGERCVSYVVGDGAGSACVEASAPPPLRPAASRRRVGTVGCVLFVSFCVPTRARISGCAVGYRTRRQPPGAARTALLLVSLAVLALLHVLVLQGLKDLLRW